MKTTLLLFAALTGRAICARAAEGYSDPSERARESATTPSDITIKMADTDPFEMRVRGVTFSTAGVPLPLVDTDPYQLHMKGYTSSTAGVRLPLVDTDPYEMRVPAVRLGFSQPTSVYLAASSGQSAAPAAH